MDDDIWFDLCVGNVEVDDDGTHHYKAEFTRLSQLSASNITSIAKYREMLHKLLDKAIDHIESAQQSVRPTPPSGELNFDTSETVSEKMSKRVHKSAGG